MCAHTHNRARLACTSNSRWVRRAIRDSERERESRISFKGYPRKFFNTATRQVKLLWERALLDLIVMLNLLFLSKTKSSQKQKKMLAAIPEKISYTLVVWWIIWWNNTDTAQLSQYSSVPNYTNLLFQVFKPCILQISRPHTNTVLTYLDWHRNPSATAIHIYMYIYVFIRIYTEIYIFIYIYVYFNIPQSHHEITRSNCIIKSQDQITWWNHIIICVNASPYVLRKTKIASLIHVQPPSLFALALSARSSPVCQCVSQRGILKKLARKMAKMHFCYG